MHYCELKKKDVINTIDGSSLGCITDFVFDVCNGRILSIIVSAPFRFTFFCGNDDCVCIPWCDICTIGTDVILVRVDPAHLKYK